MTDRFASHGEKLDAPASGGFAITKSDSTVFTIATRALWIGGAGSGGLSVVMVDGTTVTLAGVPVGLLPLRCTKVLSTGTDVTNIVGLY